MHLPIKICYLEGVKVRNRTEGYLVLFYGDAPRSTFKRGRIEEPYKGNDGQERSARVRTQGRDITRALSKLYPLELTIREESNPDETAEDIREKNSSVLEKSEDKNDPNLSSDCRPRRNVFTKALQCLTDTLDDDDINGKESLPVASMS